MSQQMIAFDKAASIMLEAARTLPEEEVSLNEAAGRILRQRILAETDMPPFDRSAVDGFACRRSDLGEVLTLVGKISAGTAPACVVGTLECAKIMTGAEVPPGADCVFMVEHAEEVSPGQIRHTQENCADHIRKRGEDIEKGAILLAAGTRLRPQDVAVAASAGLARISVSQRPRITILATGDELVEPGAPLGSAQIRNSNSYQLYAQVVGVGGLVVYTGIVRDSRDSLREHISQALENSDVLILSGGVSMGDYDYVPEILQEKGVNLLFEKVAVQPGKPTVFGLCGDTYCIGLPGNPVASFVIFDLLVKPFLYRLMGGTFTPLPIVARLGEDFSRSNTSRMAWIPIYLDDEGCVRKVAYHGSGHLDALSRADGLIAFPEGVGIMPSGNRLPIRLLWPS